MTHTNRLAAETSPYLLQHAHNPVDWFPWGPEAFEIARRENKPIFLSVGYSTCYWCHVMERQCFEVEAIAAEMNKRFVNIKVDREERPDVDQLYMNAVQLITRQGGWPMSVFLTPDLKPFYGGTYFPPTDAHGRPGFPRILEAIEDAYKNRPGEVAKSAEQITNLLRQIAQPPAPAGTIQINEMWIRTMIARSISDYDPQHGGFGSAPKFPRETVLELILTYLRGNPDDKLLKQLTHTLDAMADGGIRDQLGGAFHRYSTDAQWLVPHFEIMLYDNAMLAWIYAEAYRQTEEIRYAHIARGICDFVLREMTSPAGAFYTAFDAEVDGQEGQNYLWTQAEVQETLRAGGISEKEISRFCKIYGLDQGPNFADPHHGNGMPDKNILFLAEPALLDETLAPMRELLYAARRERKQPLLDTKILTSWNALMIRALAYVSDVLQEDRYLKAAEAAADFLLKHHRDAQGGLLRTSRDGPAKYPGFLDDYAYFVQALLALEDAADSELRADQAGALAIVMREKFAEEDSGGFYFTEKGAPDLIVRQKTGSDSPLPSGNGVAAMAMIELDEADIARATISAFAAQLKNGGEGMSALVQAAMLYSQQYGPIEVGAATQAERPKSPAQQAGDIVAISSSWAGPLQLDVVVKIAEGFHINAYDAGPELSATRLSIAGDAAKDVLSIDYPPGEQMQFAFSEKPVKVYGGEIFISVRFAREQVGPEAIGLSLFYQACDDKACLLPVSKNLKISRT